MSSCILARARSALPLRIAIVGLLSLAAVPFTDLTAQVAQTPSNRRARINGRVVDLGTNQPLEGVNVIIVGTPVAATTGPDGRFVIASAPVGIFSIEAKRLGYGLQRLENIRLHADSLTTLDFKLNSNPLRLDAVTTSATVDPTSGRNSPVNIDKLSAEDMPVAASGASAATMLQGKVAGLTLTKSSGAPGSGVNIVLRAPISGIDQGGSAPGPLFVVDGVFLNQTQQVTTQDIEAMDIASIEVLKGAAAAALYGSRAAAGVISITTNRGKNLAFGTTEFTLRSEYGQDTFSKDLEKNQHHNFRQDASGNWLNAQNQIVARNLRATNQFNIMDQPYTSPTYNHAKQFFSPGSFNTQTAMVQGNSAASNYTLSYQRTQAPGVLQYNDGYTRQSLRLNIDSRINERLNIGVSAAHERGKSDAVASTFTNFYRFDTDVDLLRRDPFPKTAFPYLIIPDSVTNAEHPLYQQFRSDNETKRSRTNLNINGAYRPFAWLSVNADISYDRGDLNRIAYTPRGIPIVSNSSIATSTGQIDVESDITDGMQITAGPTFTKSFGDLTVRVTERGELQRETNPFIQTRGTDFTTEGLKAMSVAATKSVPSQSYTDRRAIASMTNLGLNYGGKYILDGLVRREGSSLFGRANRWNTYFRAAGAYMLSEEGWFPLQDFSTFKLRYSIGTAGERPAFSDQYEALTSDGTGGITTSFRGNKLLTPTVSREQELGLDMTYKNRLTGTFNYVTNKNTDVFNDIPAPASSGYNTYRANVGTVTSNTMEATIQGQVLSNPKGFNWTVLATAAKSRNYNGVFGRTCFFDDQNGPLQRCDGTRIGEVWTNRMVRDKANLRPTDQPFASAFDINDEGFVVPVGVGNTYKDGIAKSLWGTQVNINGQNRAWGIPFLQLDPTSGAAVVEKVGDFNPAFNFGLSNTFRYKAVRVYFLMSGQVGGDIYNDSKRTFYASGDHKDVDQYGKAEELKKPVTYYTALASPRWSETFVESASHLAFSELLIGYTLDSKAHASLKRLGVSRLSIDLVGRNLGIISPYKGLNVQTGTPFNRIDAVAYPYTRTFTAAMGVTF